MDPFNLMCPRRPLPVVKSSATSSELDFDESLIDRILGTPEKIQIPERYIPEEEPQLNPEEEQKRSLKAERICRLLSKSNGGNLPLVLPPATRKLVPPQTHDLSNGVQSVPCSPARTKLVSVKKSATPASSLKRRPVSTSSSLCDWSLAGVIPPPPHSTWSRDTNRDSISASERLFGAPVPPAFGIGEHSPIPYEKGVVIGGTKVDYFKASVHHQQQSSSSQSSSSGRSSASADREDLLHLQQYLAREVTEKSRVVAIRALATPSPPDKHSFQRHRDPSPPSPVELPTVQQPEPFVSIQSSLHPSACMHPDLASHLHSKECIELINALKECHEQNKFGRFLGFCNEANSAMLRCLKKEREQRRKENYEKSLAKKLKARDAAAESKAN